MSLSWGQRQNPPLSLLVAPSRARRHTPKTLGPVSFPTTRNPLTGNSLFLEGAAPFLATGVRMQHGTAVHTRVPEPDCLGPNTGPASYPLYNLSELIMGSYLTERLFGRGGGSACEAPARASSGRGTGRIGDGPLSLPGEQVHSQNVIQIG